ncbi:MAG: SDR family NAD(P)-dependent oxidoreductase [Halieaceae bacterium]|nr:SDR family NAD(P)-dependent oxidoreductase [Halieaceae bacterium]
MAKLENKVVIVTGAGRGIGRGMCLALAEEGAKVVVSSRTASSIEKVVKEIRSKGGIAEAVVCDVSQKEQVDAMIERSAELFGKIDVLINNAQSFGTEKDPMTFSLPKSFEDLPLDEWEWTMRTGLWSTVWGMKAVFPYLKENGGKIINLASPAGVYAAQGASAYVATKEGVRGLSKVAARDWGQYKITVNCILPAILTDNSAGAYEAYMALQDGDADLENTANILGYLGDPYKDIGPVAVFLCSSDSDYMTGHDFSVDGGYYLRP